ncbi:MarR family transcriptional regulator [Paucilactobacillus suebicus]|uniref:Transcriptional regulator n=1 Tax=Paucilactobacillus suebicus DSM 5007 = KCTC 3549 TaxID=1423807 RepID=A0A0R1WAK8_9LACO|nr:MarR family transcriptional regulator [Paucilactobacillus suebicus]KRM12118.1 transcriptional regulator [Paucilactobacillus suebicus DSM 5007 = KCTC 3549]
MTKPLPELPGDQLGPRLKMLDTLVEKELNNTISKVIPNLTGVQVAVLNTLYIVDDEMSQKSLELNFRLSHPTTRGIVKRLSLMNYIQARKSDTDARQVMLSLSPIGKEFMDAHFDQISKLVDQVEKKMTKDVTPGEQHIFMEVVDKMINNF